MFGYEDDDYDEDRDDDSIHELPALSFHEGAVAVAVAVAAAVTAAVAAVVVAAPPAAAVVANEPMIVAFSMATCQ